eukprot:4818529-Pleurochrysis_carterae.AAC.1
MSISETPTPLARSERARVESAVPAPANTTSTGLPGTLGPPLASALSPSSRGPGAPPSAPAPSERRRPLLARP